MLDLGGIPLLAAERGAARPAGDRRRAVRLQSRSRWPTSWTPCCSATARRRWTTSATSTCAGTGATAARCCARWREIPGVYVPALYAPAYTPPTGACVDVEPLRDDLPRGGREARPARSRHRAARRDARRAEHQGRARPPEPRSDARLRQGLPLLPGGLHLPAAARARPAAACWRRPSAPSRRPAPTSCRCSASAPATTAASIRCSPS